MGKADDSPKLFTDVAKNKVIGSEVNDNKKQA